MNNDNLVPMGKIVGAHGRTGTVKVISYAESWEIFRQAAEIYVTSPQDTIQKQTIRWVKPHHRNLLISFKEINNRTAASNLKSSVICVHRNRLPELAEDTYYWFDLIGISVVNDRGEALGIIERIIDTGAHDVYVVKDGKKEILIPAVASVIEKVDLQNRHMRVNYTEPV